MKRDLNLIRRILLDVEADPIGKVRSHFEYEDHPEAEIMEHVSLLIEANYLEGQMIPDAFGWAKGCMIRKLTWTGHEFLANAKNDTVWKKVTNQIGDKAMSVSVTVLNTLLTNATTQFLK